MRDFIHIKDVIRGSLLISKKVKNVRAINLSSGKFISFIDLSKKILKILGKKDLKVLGNSSKPEMFLRFYNCAKKIRIYSKNIN